MKRYFVYELKKNFWTFVVLTAILTIVYVVTVSTAQFFYVDVQGNIYNSTSGIGTIYLLLGIISAVVPVLMYSFKMNKRSVDTFYALSIKREKMYLVKTLVGLFLVLTPYTIAYWLGFLTVVFRENYFRLVYYIPGYFVGVLFGICMYGIYSFAFTRANRIVDGIVFMIAYAFIGVLVAGVLDEISPNLCMYRLTLNFSSFGGLTVFGNDINALICGQRDKFDCSAITYLYPILFAAVSCFLMFFLLKYEKGEEAEQTSDSWLGYRILLPVYMALLLAIADSSSLLLYACMVAVGGIVMTIVYRRKLFFGWQYWAMLGGALLLGVLLNLAIS